MNTLPGTAASDDYARLFDEKVAATKQEMQEFMPPALECFSSPEKHFRMRAEFKIWHEGDLAHYAMYEPGKYKKPIKIDSFEIGSETICALMPELLQVINHHEELKVRLFQVEFLTSTLGECLITLIYHRKLDEAWQRAAAKIEQQLSCKVVGRSRGQKIVLSEDYIYEVLTVNAKDYRYQQVETGFTQPNAEVCAKMLSWAQRVSENLDGDLLELYCGNGNFTIPLAQNFRRVLATEVSKTSVKSAQINIELNGCDNIDVVRMSSEEFTQAMNNEREFRRLRDIELAHYQFSTVFVDPPRAGLDKHTVDMVSNFPNILYVSCNPETLKENLRTLIKTHKIERLAFFDQFPYTPHRECAVLLCQR